MSKANLKLVQEPKKSRSKQAVDAPRGRPIFMMLPEEIVIVGIDCEDDASTLNDERLELPLDEVLVDSIMRYGVKKNVLVRKNRATKKVEVVDGRQRVLCAREANRRLVEKGGDPVPIPVRTEDGDDDLMFELQITLNHHVESTPLMRARTASRYMQRNKTKEETARVCGISMATLENWMTLLQMDKSIHDAVDSGKISSHQALKFSNLTRSGQQKAVKALIEMGPAQRRPARTKNTTDKEYMPSKEALLNLVLQGEDKLDPNFILGIKYALGQVGIKDVPGLAEMKGKK